MRRLATTYAFLAATFHDFSLLSKTYARYRSLIADYALRVHSDPLAGCGPCGRPPLQGNQFPIRGADGHKGRALQMADTTHERPKVSLRALSLRRNNSAARLSLRLCEKTLCGSISSAAPRENIYAAARIDLHHSKGFMGLGQNRLYNRLNLGDALMKSGGIVLPRISTLLLSDDR